MKLSEAIRLGAMLKPQGFGHIDNDGTCALGAAYDALGKLNDKGFYYEQLMTVFPILRIADRVACPVCHQPRGMFQLATIPHLNDDHLWTRERIADWVEQIEQQQEQQTTAEAVSVTVRP